MIGYLEGLIKYAAKGKVILYANGIGFTVHLPANLSFLEGQKAQLYIHTHIREDDLALYGFASPEDLDMFEMLIGVSGIGPKIGLAIFSSAQASQISKAIQNSDLNFFTAISGVGKKTAQRLILDLKTKVGRGDVNMTNLAGESELVDSLLALGFQKMEISSIYSKINSEGSLSDQVKQALKLLKR